MNKKISPVNIGIPHHGFIAFRKRFREAGQLFADFFLIV